MNDSNIEFTAIPRDVSVKRIAVSLSRFTGPRKAFSDTDIAEALGIEPGTVQSHRLGDTTPDGPTLINYCGILGPTFVNAVFGLAGITGAVRVEAMPLSPQSVLAAQAEAVASLAASLADGKFTIAEKIEARKKATDLATMLAAFAADLGVQINFEIGRADP